MLNKDFKEFIESLRLNAVDFLIVGAHALAAHGRPRYTGDIDIWVRPERDIRRGLLRHLRRSALRLLACQLKIFGCQRRWCSWAIRPHESTC